MNVHSVEGNLITSFAPADGSTVARAQATSADDVHDAVAAARSTQSAWERMGPVKRSERIAQLGRLISNAREALSVLIAREVGKPLIEAEGEVTRGAAICGYYAGIGQEIGGDLRRSADPSVMILARDVAVGVAGVITPWNFPLAIPLWKIVPALAAGCSVVWKPAPQAIGTAEELMKLAAAANIVPDALTVVQGDQETGQALIASDVDGISFTGSSAVGEAIRGTVARRPVRLVLELGGVNVAHVLPDADMAAAADDLIAAAFGFAGQKCTATQVIVADATIADQLADLLIERMGRLAVGDPQDRASVMGPVIDQAAAHRIRTQVSRLAETHAVHHGPCLDGPAWVAPVLVRGEREVLTTQECFGPVATLISTDGLGDHAALARAGGSALSSAVYGRDADAVRRMINIAGTAVVAVNRPSTGLDPHVPFGGWGPSAAGTAEQGREGLRFYTKRQTVYWKGTGVGTEFP